MSKNKNHRILLLLLPYLLIILIASLVRFFYWQYAPYVIVSEDTFSYYEVGQTMLKEFFFVNNSRTPVYSLLLTVVVNGLGLPNTPVLSWLFFEKVLYMIPFQMIMGLLGLLILYHTLRLLKLNPILSLMFILFIGTNIIIFSWERLLLTESLATFSLILLVYISVKIFYKPGFIFFFIFLFLSIFSVMLRPFNIGLPVIPLIITILIHRKIKVAVYIIIILLLYSGFIHIYSVKNQQRLGFYGISQVSDINLLGKILEYRLPLSAGIEEKSIYDMVSEYQMLRRDSNPFRFLEYYNLIDEESIPKLLQLKKFGYSVISANLPEYLLKSTLLLPGALMDVSEKIIILPPEMSTTSRIFNINLEISRSVQIIFFLIFIFSGISVIGFLKKPSIINSTLTLAAGISLYQIALAVFTSPGEYGRLIVPAQPVMYFYSFYWFNKIIDRGKKYLIRLRGIFRPLGQRSFNREQEILINIWNESDLS